MTKDKKTWENYFRVRLNLMITLKNSTSTNTAQKMKFSIKDIFSKCDQICRKIVLPDNCKPYYFRRMPVC